MKHLSFIFLFLLSVNIYSQTEMKYNAKSENFPNWAELMYSENPDKGEVIKLYREYYKTNELVKNKHTQYYKRWIRHFSRYTNSKLARLKTALSTVEAPCPTPITLQP